MRQILALIGLFLFTRSTWADELPEQLLRVQLPVAQSPQTSDETTPLANPPKNPRIAATVTRLPTGEPVTELPANTPTLYLRWQGEDITPGDKIRCIWIAEDVGSAAPADYHVNEVATITTDARPFGTFSLSRPKKGWPIGRYRAEIYVGDRLAQTVRFTIEQAGP